MCCCTSLSQGICVRCKPSSSHPVPVLCSSHPSCRLRRPATVGHRGSPARNWASCFSSFLIANAPSRSLLYTSRIHQIANMSLDVPRLCELLFLPVLLLQQADWAGLVRLVLVVLSQPLTRSCTTVFHALLSRCQGQGRCRYGRRCACLVAPLASRLRGDVRLHD